MIACPICVNAREACLGGGQGGESNTVFFYSVDDLIYHLKEFHARNAFRGKSK
jgi:hypothetical protein